MQEQPKFDWDRFKKVQQNLPNVPKAGQGNYGSYMKLEDLNTKMLKLLNDNDFVWVTNPTSIDGQPALQYAVVDTKSGAKHEGSMLLSMDKNTPQGQGSGLTYARRYALTAVTGIVADMDDDGQTASDKPPAEDSKSEETLKFEIGGFKNIDEMRKYYSKLSPAEKKLALPIIQEKSKEIEPA